jgi:hypothetical protein
MHHGPQAHPGTLYGAAIVALSIWFLHGFVHACSRQASPRSRAGRCTDGSSARVRKHVGKHVTAFMFTAIITVFVLAPLIFALWALLSESQSLFRQIAGADDRGIVLPPWLQGLPVLGSGLNVLSSPGALLG